MGFIRRAQVHNQANRLRSNTPRPRHRPHGQRPASASRPRSGRGRVVYTRTSLAVRMSFNPTATLVKHALLAEGFMEVQKASFPHCLRPQNRDFTCANLVEALK